jgi:SpoIID/LytB domain protein
MRAFLDNPPDVYCNCTDESILERVLTPHDRETRDFFRWQKTLSAPHASELVAEKTGLDLGRIVALEPVERGLSGRLKRLRLVGDAGSLVIGKELEIRRALSSSHLYSSAFVVDIEGPTDRPDAFILRGAGWGHGVGLCQIGAAVMGCRGKRCEEILNHYYPGAGLERIYE